ncbi:INT6 protein, partial [Polypterus senegalus]|nr:integrator complex subunit 6 isoform X1 [Polypterus senegalus]MBN3290223.1 INT6 protein [Polypterus senegalus]
MPILLFLIDTSASMNQRTYLGTTYLDIAKGAVETFMKLRSRDPASRGDRYMLVTFEDPPYGIKAGWKENHATFMNELKNLQAVGLTTIGQSLRTAFDLLNLNRLVSGIDNYGQGRNPFFLEPAIIVTITDGNKLTSTSGVQDELHLPLNTPLPGSELTKEPFRWDQRLFALVLRIPGKMTVEQEQVFGVPLDDSPITPMCDVTGGRSYSICSQKMLNQCLESLVQKIQSGVVVHFEKTGPDLQNLEDGSLDVTKVNLQPWHSCHRLIYVRPNPKTGVPIGHWPIPESFWPDQNSPTLPPRSAHPLVRFSCVDSEPMVIDKLPFDKYELEPSPLTQYILERKSPHICWQVFVGNSAKYSDLGLPFGYLKASTALNCVNLFVMPYNFPVLLPLLDDLFKVHKLKPSLKWRQSFETYLKSMPPYYIGPLKKALRMMGAPNVIAENMEYGLSYSVVSYLKKLSQQAKIESDRVIASVGKKLVQETGIRVKNKFSVLSLAQHRNFRQLLQGIDAEAQHHLLEINMKEFSGFQIANLNKDVKPQSFRNAYDIQRRNLLDQLTRMRSNLLKAARGLLKGQDEDQIHSITIAQMGNYQEFLKSCPSPLREVDPDQPKRLHTFGNPFKLDKKGMMIDEADEFVTGPQNKNKRPGDSNLQGMLKRRRSMSPLFRGAHLVSAQGVTNHTGGKLSLASPAKLTQTNNENSVCNAKVLETSPVVYLNSVLENNIENEQKQDLEDTRASVNSENSSFESLSEVENHIEDVCIDLYPDMFIENLEDEQKLAQSPSKIKRMKELRCQENNAELKVLIIREIRKPGRRYEKIFFFLEQLQGTLQTRIMFLQNIMKEAARFKKKVLIEQLEGFLEEVHQRYSQINHVGNTK